MHLSQRTRQKGAGVQADPTKHPSASSQSHVRMSTLVLFITRDRNLTDRLTKSLSDFAGDALTIESITIESVERVSEATQRMKQNAGVDAVIMDWDLPETHGFESLLVLMAAAPHLPIIILGDDPNLLQQMNLVEHGAQDYLLKRRLDADTMMGMVHSAIARKSREGILFFNKERAQVTLNSIGDAVLSTDGDWRITFLNPVAERLIGWTDAEASGQQLTDVFQVINATTRERIAPCLKFEVGKGRTTILPPNCVLVRRDGHESPIEDSAAPIHNRNGGVVGLVVVFHDVSEAQAMARGMTHPAEHDSLTSLPNRGLLDDRLEMNSHAAERRIIREDLRHALDRGEFALQYQPKVNLASGAITGVEALIRWHHPSRGVLPPLEFVQIAEECGLIVQIGQWVLRAACMQAKTWLATGIRFGTMAVNISAVEFCNDGFFAGVCGILEYTGLEPRYLELELTETAVMRNFDATSAVLQSLSAMGIRIAVDDFGTGYSNLSYLKRFPINTLKLDKSFVQDIPANADIATIVRSVIHMGQSLHLRVVAEGVENAEQLKFLQAHNCAEGQGFYFSKPLHPSECQALISVAERHWVWQSSFPTLRAVQ